MWPVVYSISIQPQGLAYFPIDKLRMRRWVNDGLGDPDNLSTGTHTMEIWIHQEDYVWNCKEDIKRMRYIWNFTISYKPYIYKHILKCAYICGVYVHLWMCGMCYLMGWIFVMACGIYHCALNFLPRFYDNYWIIVVGNHSINPYFRVTSLTLKQSYQCPKSMKQPWGIWVP